MLSVCYQLVLISCVWLLCAGAVPDYLDQYPANHQDPRASNSVSQPTGLEPTQNGSQEMSSVQLAGREPVTHTVSLAEATTAQDPCLALCTCNTITKHVDCSFRALHYIPTGLPSDVHYLDLSNNNLSRIEDSDLKGFWQLQQLDLSFNHLWNVSASVFSDSTSLRSLYLQHNQLDEGFFTCVDYNEILIIMDNETVQDISTSAVVCNITSLELLDITYNSLTALPRSVLSGYPRLEVLQLDYNILEELPVLTDIPHPLQHLSISHNQLYGLNCASVSNLSELHHLDVGYNQISRLPQALCSNHLVSLTTLTLNGNTFNTLSPQTFNLTSLTTLNMEHLDHLRYLPPKAFTGLPSLHKLVLSHNQQLAFIHVEAFSDLTSLEILDLSDCGLCWLHEKVFQHLDSLWDIKLSGNPWNCLCDLEWLPLLLRERFALKAEQQPNLLCQSPLHLYGQNLLNTSYSMECENPALVDLDELQYVRVGRPGVINCLEEGNPHTRVVWLTAEGQEFEYDPGYNDFYNSDPYRPGYHDDHSWHGDGAYYHTLKYKDRITILYNGSLYLDYSTRHDAGNYTCFIYHDGGNQTAIIHVRIDTHIQWFKVMSIAIGFGFAFSFFFITMVAHGIYFLAVRCSARERKKRKSIREVLNSLHDFKTVQIDRLCAYKTAKLNKLSAFKNAKIHKLVAFKTAKVDKLRNYKQVTVASIFHHLEKMREHYNCQMNKVKDNCTMQMDKLRENYNGQVDKIKDYKVEKMDRIRDNYNNQLLKVRDYRSSQMMKLRDQYKLQQQHLLKLMELLDIGNCLHVVEAECQRTESMIFNPNISFDLEAEPVHIQRNMDFSDVESDYMTAGSQSDLSMSDNTFTVTEHHADTHTEDEHHHSQGHHHHPRNRFLQCAMGQSPSEATLSGPSGEMPPPPMFQCELPELNNQSLEQLVSDAEEAAEYFADIDEDDPEFEVRFCVDDDSDDISMYQTPPDSTHQDIVSGTAQVVPPDTTSHSQPGTSTQPQPGTSTQPQPGTSTQPHTHSKHTQLTAKKETVV